MHWPKGFVFEAADLATPRIVISNTRRISVAVLEDADGQVRVVNSEMKASTLHLKRNKSDEERSRYRNEELNAAMSYLHN